MSAAVNTPASVPLRISGVVQDSIVDGPGMRYVIFVQGCPHHCPGCHNPSTHDFSGGCIADVARILKQIQSDPLMGGVTFSGGEPFCQAEALYALGVQVKALGKHLAVYSGYTYGQLIQKGEDDPFVFRLLEIADMLVDGPYIETERDLTLQFRGSRNQQVIDLQSISVGTGMCAL